MKRVLITGMSGVGKSTVIKQLSARGYKAVDLDHPPYADGAEFNIPEVVRLLDTEDVPVLFVSGTSERQVQLYPRFDHVVLLTAPDDVMTERMRTRLDNPYGKEPLDIARQLSLKTWVEPALRGAADLEIDTRVPVNEVVRQIIALVESGDARRR